MAYLGFIGRERLRKLEDTMDSYISVMQKGESPVKKSKVGSEAPPLGYKRPGNTLARFNFLT